VAAAREQVGDVRCGFLVADATATDFARRTFDQVVSFETIEHIADDEAYVAEMRRVLRPTACSSARRRTGRCSTRAPRLRTGRSTRTTSASTTWRSSRDPAPSLRHRRDVRPVAVYRAVYARGLAAVGRRRPRLAVRLHQARKLATAPVTPGRQHGVQPIVPGTVPEMLVALCRP
jgi:SAM-dependent methyltransferase